MAVAPVSAPVSVSPGAWPAPLPLVGIPACRRLISDLPYHTVGDKYVQAVSLGAGALPVLIPALGENLDIEDLLPRLDGLFITGSASNVLPEHYGGTPSDPGTLHDPDRDATIMPLIRAAVARGVPVLGICRGLQELNVALGGSLHQNVHQVPGLADHRPRDEDPTDVQYGPSHRVRVLPGGRLAALWGEGEIAVNSLHGQGIDTLAPGLIVETVAPDGLIEAVSLAAPGSFVVAVQWHPEWRFWENLQSQALFRAFGDAVRQRAALRREP